MSLSREELIRINGEDAVREWEKDRSTRDVERAELLGRVQAGLADVASDGAGIVSPDASRSVHTGEVPVVSSPLPKRSNERK